MAIKSKEYLKSVLRNGDTVTEEKLVDLIDTLISQVDSRTPDAEGNVNTDYKIIDVIPADHPPSDYPSGLSEFYADYDPANYVDYIASHPDMEQLDAGKLCIRTFKGPEFTYQQVDNVKNGVFEAAFVRMGLADDTWGPLTPTSKTGGDALVHLEEIAPTDGLDEIKSGYTISKFYSTNTNAKKTAWLDVMNGLVQHHDLTFAGTAFEVHCSRVGNDIYQEVLVLDLTPADGSRGAIIANYHRLYQNQKWQSWEKDVVYAHIEEEVEYMSRNLYNHERVVASESALGHVRIDNSTIVADANGTISAVVGDALINMEDVLPTTPIEDIKMGLTLNKFFYAGDGKQAWYDAIRVINVAKQLVYDDIALTVKTIKFTDNLVQEIDVYEIGENDDLRYNLSLRYRRIYLDSEWKPLKLIFGDGSVTAFVKEMGEAFTQHIDLGASNNDFGHVRLDDRTIKADSNNRIYVDHAITLMHQNPITPQMKYADFNKGMTIFNDYGYGAGGLGQHGWASFLHSSNEFNMSTNYLAQLEITTNKDDYSITQEIKVYVQNHIGSPKYHHHMATVTRKMLGGDDDWSKPIVEMPVLRGHGAPGGLIGATGQLYVDFDTNDIYQCVTAPNGLFESWNKLLPKATVDEHGIVKVDGSSLVVDEDGVISVAPSLGGPGAEPPMREIIYDEIVNDEFWDTGVFVLRANDNNDFDFGQAVLNVMPHQQDFIVDLTYDQYYDADNEALVKLKHIEMAPMEGPNAHYWRGIVKYVIYDDADIEPEYSFVGMYPLVATMDSNTFFINNNQAYDINVANLVQSNTLYVKSNGKLDIVLPSVTANSMGIAGVDNETIKVIGNGDLKVDPAGLIHEDTEGIRVEDDKIIMSTGTPSVKGITYLSSNPLHEGADSAPNSTIFKAVVEDVEDLKEQANDFAPVDDGNGNLNISPGHVYVDGTTITIDDGVISALVTDNAWVFSATEPTSASENQVYFNTSTKKLYQYNGTAWLEKGDLSSGAKGDQGEQGQPGDTVQWHFGSGTPDNATGKNGDLYVKEEDGKVYKKVSGAYVDQEYSVTGPQGEQGEQGDAFTYADFTPAQLEALKVKGDKGENGDHYLITKHFDNYIDLEAHTFPIPMNAIQFYAIVNEDDPMHGNVYAVQYDDVLEEHTIEFVHNLQDANTLKGEQGPKGEKGDQGDMPELANNLTTTDVEKGLAAPQGKILKEALDAHKGVKATKVASGHITVGDGLNVTDGVVSAPAKGYFYGTYSNTSAAQNNNYFPHNVVYSTIEHTPGAGNTGHVTLTCGKAYRVTLAGRIEFSGSGSEAGFAIYDKTGGATVSQSHGHWGSLNYATAKAMPNNLDFILLVPEHPSGTRNYTIRCTGTVSGNPPYFAQWGEIRLLVQEI